jgi:hypothetical protein
MIVFVLALNKYVKGNLAMSDKKELLTIAVIAAALMLVLGTSIPSSVLASSIEAAEPAQDNGNNDGSSDDNGKDNSDGGSSNDGGSSSSSEDNANDDDGSTSSDNDNSGSNNGGIPDEYLGEYSTCVTDLSTDDNTLTQDDVVDCYGQVFGPNPSHDLGPLTQNVPTPVTNMPGLENMPSALSQPQDGQPQQQAYPAVGDQQQVQPLGQTQPQDGQPQQQAYPTFGDQHQMSPSQLPIDSGILDANTIKEIVKSRLGQ